jgi:hypothetical protein
LTYLSAFRQKRVPIFGSWEIKTKKKSVGRPLAVAVFDQETRGVSPQMAKSE